MPVTYHIVNYCFVNCESETTSDNDDAGEFTQYAYPVILTNTGLFMCDFIYSNKFPVDCHNYNICKQPLHYEAYMLVIFSLY